MQENEEQGKEAKKVLANFENTVRKLTAIVQGPLKVENKVPKEGMAQLVEELFKEENEATAVQVKTKLKALLKGYVTLNSSLTEERKKLDQLEVAKKKEFNAEASKLFAQIGGIDDIAKEYHSALEAAKSAVENENKEE